MHVIITYLVTAFFLSVYVYGYVTLGYKKMVIKIYISVDAGIFNVVLTT